MAIDFFGKGFSEGVGIGLPLGVSAYNQGATRRENSEEKLREQQLKIAKQNQQTRDFANLTGQDITLDEYGVAQVKTPEGWLFNEDKTKYAELYAGIGNEYQETYKGLVDQNKPDYVGGGQRYYNPETNTYDVKMLNRKSGQMESVGVDNDYNKVLFDEVIDGVVDVDGTKFGTKGRRSRLKVYEKKGKDGQHQFEILDKGLLSSGSNSSKSKDDAWFEGKLADIQERVDNIQNKRKTYVSGKFPDEQAREMFLTGMRSDLNELSLEFLNLGSPQAKDEMLKMFKEGKEVIQSGGTAGGLQINRQQYYEMKKKEVSDAWVAGEWGYRDAMAMLNFLNAKFGLYPEYEDAQKNSDDLEFDTILNETQLEKK